MRYNTIEIIKTYLLVELKKYEIPILNYMSAAVVNERVIITPFACRLTFAMFSLTLLPRAQIAIQMSALPLTQSRSSRWPSDLIQTTERSP
jgi:hypothetical protein